MAANREFQVHIDMDSLQLPLEKTEEKTDASEIFNSQEDGY